MRILVISRTPWRKDNSFGNTYSNFFCNMDNVEIANIYLGDGIPDPDNRNVISYYCLSEEKLAKSLLTRKMNSSVGGKIDPKEAGEKVTDITVASSQSKYKKLLKIAKIQRWNILFSIREFIWKHGKYDKQAVLKYVKEFDPDIIFLSFYYAEYVSNFALFLKDHFDIPMVSEAAIDIYTLKQISFDPVFWFHRFAVRKVVRETAAKSEFLYVISQKQKEDYERLLHKECRVLYKGVDPDRKEFEYSGTSGAIKYLFTGNISSNRWKGLSLLARAIKKHNAGQLDIYTATPITSKMKAALSNCNIHPPVTSEEVLKLQNEADVLVHVESFDLRSKLSVRYSISTKVMDYISTERCILAIGPDDVASIEFIKDNDVGIVANNNQQIETIVLNLLNNPDLLMKNAHKCRDYVTRRKSEKSLQKYLYDGLSEAIKGYNRHGSKI